MQGLKSSVKYLKLIVIVITTLRVSALSAQQPENTKQIQAIYAQALGDGRCYDWLTTLCKDVGHRLSGSVGAERAVQWSKSVLDTLGLDSVWLQPVMVPRWVRGERERAELVGPGKKDKKSINVLALGGSVGTNGQKLRASIVEARSWSDLEKLGRAGIEGKIVFFNRPMDPTRIRSFDAYGGAVDQRVSGASKAAQYGAVAVMVRSMTQNIDQWPHTGSLRYDPDQSKIPAVAISTAEAEALSKRLKKGDKMELTLIANCQTLSDVPSFNVIGEIRGRELPNSYIIAGGHLDSWDVGEGAHDDGAGSVQSMDMLRILKKTGIKPRHTIRCVLFMNEENGLRGGVQYAAEAERKGERHACAIETDAGGFTPRGFTFDGEAAVFDSLFSQVKPLRPYFEPYNMVLNPGGGGADIGPLKKQNVLLCGYYPDSQRYFDFHHTEADVLEAVNKRELELGSGSLAALVFLLDQILH